MDVYKGIYILFFIICFTVPSKGQEFNKRFDATYFEIENFPSANITSMAKDKDSFLWIATSVGLYRFDGREYKGYFHDKDDPSSLPNNFIYKNFVDSNNRLWLNGYSFDLAYLNRNNGEFVEIELPEYGDIGLFAYKFLEPAKDVMLLLTGRGLVKLTDFNKEKYTAEVFFNDTRFLDAIIDENNKIWLTTDQGLYSIEDINDIKTSFKKELDLEGRIHSIEKYKQKIILGINNDLYVYDLEKEEFKNIELPYFKYSPGIFSQGIIKVLNNKFWISIQCGIVEFDAEDETIKPNVTTIGNNLPEAGYSGLFNFGDNMLIAGFRKGIYLFDFNESIFNNIGVFELNDEFTEMGFAQSLLVDGDDLWYGKHTGGLALQRNGKEYFFDISKANGEFQRGYPQVHCLIKDINKNRIWFGGHFGLGYMNLDNFNPENPELVTFTKFEEGDFYFPAYSIKDLVIDNKGLVWVATYEFGLFSVKEIESNQFKIKHFKATSEVKSRRNTNNPNSLASIQDTLWVGTDGGLLKVILDKDHENIIKTDHYYKTQDANSVSSDHIVDLTLDSRKRLWLSTFGGINLHLGQGKFKSWPDIPAYSNSILPAILADDNDNIWMSTFGSGLIKFDTHTETFELYGSEEGIKNKDWSYGKFKDLQGKLYFTGDYGITYFNPESMEEIVPKSHIYLSYVEGDFDIQQSNTLAFGSSTKQQLSLSYEQFPIQLHFSALGYSNMKVNSLYYKINPGNESWTKMAGTDLQLVDLSPGEYTLEVNGSNFKGVWEQQPYELSITVIPPWWLSDVAYIIYAVIILTSLIIVYRFLLSRKLALAESHRLKSVNEAMTNFYSNITHDFRTPLTVILGITKYLKTLDPKSNKDLKLIEKNVTQLTNMVDNIIDISKNEKGLLKKEIIQADIISYLKYLISSTSTIADLKKVNLDAKFESSELVMDYDKNYIKSIIGNLLSNAIKFTPKGGTVSCLITKNESSLQIEVKDDGVGIDKKDHALVFTKFYQSNNHIDVSERGSGIGLALTKKYVEKLGGTINISSAVGKGTNFIVQLPIRNEGKRISNSDTLMFENTVQIKSNFLDITTKTNEKPLLLVIEDNEDVQYYLTLCLESNYKLILANVGMDGYTKAIQFIPDIIICDLMLPDTDGFKITERIKQDERTDHIPIIMLTAKANQESRLKGLQHGADAYLSKPFDENELLLTIERLLDLRRKLIEKATGNFFTIATSNYNNGNVNFIKKLNEIISNNLGDPDFGPKTLSVSLNMSDSQLYRKIKALTDMSPIQFIRTYKLHQAKRLLTTTDKNISDISYELGYSDPSYFAKIFKNEFGSSPTSVKT